MKLNADILNYIFALNLNCNRVKTKLKKSDLEKIEINDVIRMFDKEIAPKLNEIASKEFKRFNFKEVIEKKDYLASRVGEMRTLVLINYVRLVKYYGVKLESDFVKKVQHLTGIPFKSIR